MNLNERLTYLGELLVTLSGAPVPSHQFQTIADFAGGVIQFDYLAVCLIDPDQQGYLVHSLAGEARNAIPQRLFDLQEGLPGHVIQRNRLLIVEDMLANEHAAADLEGACSRLGLASALIAPLSRGDEALGALFFAAAPPKVYDQDDRQVAILLAAGLSAALETARLFQALADERSTLSAVLTSSKDAILVVNPEGRILMANPAVRDMLGLKTEALTGHLASEAIANEALRQLLTGNQPEVVDITLPNGRVAQATLSPVTTPYGEQVGWAATLRDITLLKKLEQMKNEFVNTVSHDLKNPISSIALGVDLLHRAGKLNKQQQSIAGRLRNTVYYMDELVGDLLNLGKIEAELEMPLAPLDLSALLQEVLDKLQDQIEKKKQRIQVTAPSPLMAQGNPARLKQVLLNLIGNGVKYTPEGGDIAITAYKSQPGDLELPAAAGNGLKSLPDKPLVVAHIKDSGIGIPAADLPFIFDKFYRVQSRQTSEIQGTGLGLSIVKSIIEAHQGAIWVESVEGEGSVFSFYLLADREA